MPLPVRPVQPLIGAKRPRDGPGPSNSAHSPTPAPPLKRVRMSQMEIQTSETIETLEKNEKDRKELHAKEYKAIARERDELNKKHDEMQITLKEEEIKHLRELHMARVSQVSPAVLATMNSSDGSRDTLPRTKAHELCNPREPGAPRQIPQSTLSSRNTIPDPSDIYLAPQFQESINQVARATMDKINSTSGRTLGRVFPSQRPDRSLSSSERTSRAIVPTGPTGGETPLIFRVVDVRRILAIRNLFLQLAAEHPRACLNGISWNPAKSNQTISPGNHHLVCGDSLMRDLNEIFVRGQTTVLSFGGASVAQVIKMMEFQGEDQLDTLVIMIGTNDV